MRTALVCIAKNEDNYIDEWIDYHKLIGFDDVFVVQNDWRAKRYNPSAKWFSVSGERMQNAVYNNMIDKFNTDYDWMAFFDVDEFLMLKSDKSVNAFLDKPCYNDIPALAINWRIFGDNGHIRVTDFGVLNRFTKCAKTLDQTSKVMIHTAVTKNSVKFFYNPHCVTAFQFDPLLKFKLDKIGNNPHICEVGDSEPTELAHFRNKTYAECFNRHFGHDDPSPSCAETHAQTVDVNVFNESFDKFNSNEIENTLLIDFWTKYHG